MRNIMNWTNQGVDKVSIIEDLVQKEAVVQELVQNYLGNTVYLTQAVYETLFGEYQPNGVLMHLSEQCTDQWEFEMRRNAYEGA